MNGIETLGPAHLTRENAKATDRKLAFVVLGAGKPTPCRRPEPLIVD